MCVNFFLSDSTDNPTQCECKNGGYCKTADPGVCVCPEDTDGAMCEKRKYKLGGFWVHSLL